MTGKTNKKYMKSRNVGVNQTLKTTFNKNKRRKQNIFKM